MNLIDLADRLNEARNLLQALMLMSDGMLEEGGNAVCTVAHHCDRVVAGALGMIDAEREEATDSAEAGS